MHLSAAPGAADLGRLVRLTARLLNAPIAVLARRGGGRVGLTSRLLGRIQPTGPGRGDDPRREGLTRSATTLVHVEELLAPARDAAGGIWGLIGLNIEIGERKRAEARLVEVEARLRAAIESLPFDFWITDAASR